MIHLHLASGSVLKGPPSPGGGPPDTPAVAVTGTVQGATEEQIVAGGRTLILTLTADQWVPTVGADNAITDALIAGIDSSGSDPNGWDAKVKTTLAFGDVTRDSDTVVTMVLPAVADYVPTANETITVTVPATALVGAAQLVATPTITVTNTATSVALTGTAPNATEAEIVTGGKTIILTLTGDQWHTDVGADNDVTDALIAGIDSNKSEATGWDAVVKGNMVYTDVTRDTATQVTILLGAEATFDITAAETITVTVPASALIGSGSPVVASPTFLVATEAAGYSFDYYLSPTGNNGANGLTPSTPWKTFAYAFTQMSGGDVLGLLNGTYSAAAGTGTIDWDDGANSSNEIPNGSSKVDMTVLAAVNGPGNVTISNELFVGRTARKDSYIKFDGLIFNGGGNLFNTSYIYVKNCGFRKVTNSAGSVLRIGTNDHANGNTYNLVEDCWAWGKERLVVLNYRAHYTVFRRVVVRRDGLSTYYSGNPSVGITVYESTNVSQQNVVCVDGTRGTQGIAYADFSSAEHTGSPQTHGNNEWLGCAAALSPDNGWYLECDNHIAGVDGTITNCVAVKPNSYGFNVGGGGSGQRYDLQNCTAYLANANSDGMRADPDCSGNVWRNLIAKVTVSSSRYGISSPQAPSYCDVYGPWDSAYNQQACSSNCLTSDPENDTGPSLVYPFRIEAGSTLKGTGYGGGDYGANIVKRYGTDGYFRDDAGYNTLSATDLWPWPNEDVIRTAMRVDSERGFCADGQNLTDYLWNLLGNGGYPD